MRECVTYLEKTVLESCRRSRRAIVKDERGRQEEILCHRGDVYICVCQS